MAPFIKSPVAFKSWQHSLSSHFFFFYCALSSNYLPPVRLSMTESGKLIAYSSTSGLSFNPPFSWCQGHLRQKAGNDPNCETVLQTISHVTLPQTCPCWWTLSHRSNMSVYNPRNPFRQSRGSNCWLGWTANTIMVVSSCKSCWNDHTC